MKKILKVCLFLILAFASSVAFAAIATVENKPDWRAQLFIANQVKGIGLVDSYQEDGINRSYVYDNSLAAISCMASGNFGLAKEILDTLAKEVLNNAQGMPYESYIFTNTNGAGSGEAFTGNIAWLLQAMNIYQKLKASTQYFNYQKKFADYLISQQSPDGGIRGSYFDDWRSTEHNLAAYVALRNFSRLNNLSSYLTKANKVKTFLRSSKIWNGNYFNAGPNDAWLYTDVQALGVLVLGAASYSPALNYAENHLKLSRPFGSATVTGFDYNNDRDTIWLEGTLQMSLAYYKSGNATLGNYYYNEAKKALSADGACLLATNPGTANTYWYLEPWRAIAPTAWVILCRYKFNPLVQY